MTIITDNVQVKDGTDFSFVCGKIPFAISCSSKLQHGGYNLIDLDVVNKMRIPLQKIKVCRMTYMGENLRSVGYIDQTIQCVNNGVIQGTIHLSAKVVRNLFESLNVDCIASSKTYERLTGKKPPDPPDERDTEDDDHKENAQKNDCDEDNFSSGSSSVCSDGRHDPITKEWLFKASLIASAAQQDDEDTLLRTENEKANVEESDDSDEDDASTRTEDEEDDGCDWSGIPDMQCNLCFRMGQPVKIWTNHSNECPTCPTLTIKQKELMFGEDWKTRAEKIYRKRFEREQKRKKSNARP